jgi:hypothetical protein
MNIIGIDPSLISTGLVISNGKDPIKIINYCRETDASLSKGGLSKWFKLCEQEMELRFIKYKSFENYSEGELTKLNDYDTITNMIISDIEKNIDKTKETKIGIEGYSFSSSAGDIIDLVTFSTLLRKKLFDYISKDILVMAPSTLKQECCKLTYKPIDIGKKKPKLEWRNTFGISGGNFTKSEMYMSILDNENFLDHWGMHCKSVKNDILSKKTIPKPYEDINDGYIIYKYLETLS